MSSLEQINKEIRECAQKLEDLRVLREDILSKHQLWCGVCNQLAALEDWTFRQAIWYISPRLCTESQYWKTVGLESLIVCPRCDTHRRIHDLLKDTQELVLDARSLMKKGKDHRI